MHTLRLRTVSIAIVMLAAAVPATAQVVLNQAKANAGLGGCDTPGLPLTICKPGPYKLTGAITPTAANQTLIVIASNAVTLDLNGFYVGGNCSLGSTEGTGILTSGARTSVTVLNGMVSCMGDAGIFLQGNSHHVERVTATLNGNTGIWTQFDSIVRDNTANANNAGITVWEGSIVSGNTANANTNDGISAANGSLVSGNTANANSRNGISAGANSSVNGNVAFSNGTDLLGGMSMGNNACTAGKC